MYTTPNKLHIVVAFIFYLLFEFLNRETYCRNYD